MKARVLLLFAVLLLTVAPLAWGDQIALRLTAGGLPGIVIADNGPGDLDLNLGVITWTGAIGDWFLSVDTGVMDPAGDPKGSLHLNSFDEKAGGNQPLDIEFTRFDVAFPLYQYFRLDISGMISNGEVLYNAYRDVVLFGRAQTIGTIGPLGPVNFSGTAFAYVGPPPGTPYTLTQRVTINAAGATSTSFDATLKPVPEPGTGILLGLGVLAIGTLLRRRFS